MWGEDNCMIVNLRKTKEIVFHGPPARYSLPTLVTGIEQPEYLRDLSLSEYTLRRLLKTYLFALY